MKYRLQSGFTLLELLVVLGVISVMTVAALKVSNTKVDLNVAEAANRDIQRVQRASLRYYNNNSAWPANVNILVSNGYLDSGEHLDPWGAPFALATSGTDLSISVDAQNANLAAKMAPGLPRATATGTTVTTLIDPAGSEAMHDALYARDGSRPLTGEMDAGGNNIDNVGNISATNITVANNTTTNTLDATTSITTPYLSAQTVEAYSVSAYSVSASAMMADYLVDSDNSYYIIDPSGSSRMLNLTVTGTARASRWYDDNNTSYYGDFAGNSVMNTMDINTVDAANVEANNLRVTSIDSVNGSCTTGSVGRTSAGELLQCVSGNWELPGGGGDFEVSLNRVFNGSSYPRPLNNYSLGYHHFCSINGIQLGHNGDNLRSNVTPFGTQQSNGTYLWRISRDTAYSGGYERVICFTFS